jgi:membrane fusion protein (multidrug efflux system)
LLVTIKFKMIWKQNLLKRILIISSVLISFGVVIYFFINWYTVNKKYICVKNAYLKVQSVAIAAPISASVEKINTLIGAPVRKGDVVITLDCNELNQIVDNLTDTCNILSSNLRKKQADLEISKTLLNTHQRKIKLERKIKEHALKTKNSLVESSRKKVLANQKILKSGGISEIQMIQVEDEYNRQVDDYNTIMYEIEILEKIDKKMADEGILFDQGRNFLSSREIEAYIQHIFDQVKIQTIKIARAKKEIEKTRIRAPSDGIVEEILINSGERAVAGHNLLVLNCTKEQWIEAYVNETDISHIRTGSVAKLIFNAYPQRAFKGKVAHIGNAVRTSQFSRQAMQINDDALGPETNISQFIRLRIVFDNQGILMPDGISCVAWIAR